VFGALLDVPAGENPLGRTTQKQTSLHCLPCLYLSVSVFLRDFPIMVSNRPSQLWPQGDSGPGGAFAPSLWAETESGVYLGTPYAMLEET
jgi:hypothetical protein